MEKNTIICFYLFLAGPDFMDTLLFVQTSWTPVYIYIHIQESIYLLLSVIIFNRIDYVHIYTNCHWQSL